MAKNSQLTAPQSPFTFYKQKVSFILNKCAHKSSKLKNVTYLHGSFVPQCKVYAKYKINIIGLVWEELIKEEEEKYEEDYDLSATKYSASAGNDDKKETFLIQ